MTERPFSLQAIADSLNRGERDDLKRQCEDTVVASQEQRKRELRTAYAEQGIALILGGGVSVDAGVPAWAALLSRLTLAAVTHKLEPGNPIYQGYLPFAFLLQRCMPTDPLVAAQYAKAVLGRRIEAGEPNHPDFLQVIRDELYRNNDGQKSPLLDALANLSRGSRWDDGQGVREVITYNFDELFEEALVEHDCPFQSPARNTRASATGLPVYHPHGVIHRGAHAGDWAIFSESDYHIEFAAPHSWSNIIQLNAFSQLRCVFIGLSMTDPNIRRLLSAARGTDPPQHFAFLKRGEAAVVQARLVKELQASPTESDSASADDLAAIMELAALGGDTAVDVTLASLGVQVIWYAEHDELPRLVASIASYKGSAALPPTTGASV